MPTGRTGTKKKEQTGHGRRKSTRGPCRQRTSRQGNEVGMGWCARRPGDGMVHPLESASRFETFHLPHTFEVLHDVEDIAELEPPGLDVGHARGNGGVQAVHVN